jgi:L-threonylcarbamoyladenylate synthase
MMRMQGFGDDTLAAVRDAVRRGEVIAYPTETFYGLGADPFNGDAVSRVFEVKGRQAGEALPLIAAGIADVEQACGTLSPVAARLAAAFWPGALTLVLPIAVGRFPDALTAGRANVAVRVSGHHGALAVARAAGGLITSTSANRSGQPPASTADAVIAALGERISLVGVVIDDGPTPGGAPSTIVDVTEDAPRLVRAGSVPWERVLESLQR